MPCYFRTFLGRLYFASCTPHGTYLHHVFEEDKRLPVFVGIYTGHIGMSCINSTDIPLL